MVATFLQKEIWCNDATGLKFSPVARLGTLSWAGMDIRYIYFCPMASLGTWYIYFKVGLAWVLGRHSIMTTLQFRNNVRGSY